MVFPGPVSGRCGSVTIVQNKAKRGGKVTT